jgi:NADH dehydrogenase
MGTPNLPLGEKIEVAVASLRDPRGVRAAFVGVQTVIHLASAESYGDERMLDEVDVEGTRILAEAAADAGVEHLITVSHLGADKSSAFPVLRGKALAEDHIQESSVPFTILRTALAFGAKDHFTTVLSRLSRVLPVIYLIPGEGDAVLQPLWIRDLASCIVWSLGRPEILNQTLNIGGSEMLSTASIIEMVLEASQRRRKLVSLQLPLYRIWISFIRQLLRDPPISKFFADYFALSRSAGLDSVPSYFGLQPSRMERKITFLGKIV